MKKTLDVPNKVQSITMIVSGLILLVNSIGKIDIEVSKITRMVAITILAGSTLNILYLGIKAIKEDYVDAKKQFKISLIYVVSNIIMIIVFCVLD